MSDSPTPVAPIRDATPYRVPRAPTPIDLYLDGNEGVLPSEAVFDGVDDLDARALQRYPKATELEARLAEDLGVDTDQLVVTAGADDAIDRVCRAVLEPTKNAVIPVPTFEMIPRFAELTGAEVRRVERVGHGFPLDAVLQAVDDDTTLVVVISPDNPTGITADAEQITELAESCPQALILVDHAYVEFAEDHFTDCAPEFSNVVVTRTLSKAWGLAGLRIGYAVGDSTVIDWLRTVGAPYPVSKLSLEVADRWLDVGAPKMDAFVDRVVDERDELFDLFDRLGFDPTPSEANFVFVRAGDGLWWRDAMAGQGIGIRAFPGCPGLEDAIRIACPGDVDEFDRLRRAIRTVARPQALLFDLDGVFADVSRSYRQAIIETADSFGVDVTSADITAFKAGGDANNDWRVTRSLLAERGVDTTLDEVTRRFESFYQGTEDKPGLWTEESLLVDPSFFDELANGVFQLGIVTGRPRRDADRFLAHYDIADTFDTIVCMEDGPNKPDPAPVTLALERLGADCAWFVGDTPDDMRAGRAAGVLPLGIVAPGDGDDIESALLEAGAGRILDDLTDLLELLP